MTAVLSLLRGRRVTLRHQIKTKNQAISESRSNSKERSGTHLSDTRHVQTRFKAQRRDLCSVQDENFSCPVCLSNDRSQRRFLLDGFVVERSILRSRPSWHGERECNPILSAVSAWREISWWNFSLRRSQPLFRANRALGRESQMHS